MAQNPDTLPADFFTKQSTAKPVLAKPASVASAPISSPSPDTLPADFFSSGESTRPHITLGESDYKVTGQIPESAQRALYEKEHPISTFPGRMVRGAIGGTIEGTAEIPGIIKGIYHAATDEPNTDAEKFAAMGPAGGVGLAVQRLIVEPTKENFAAFWEKFKQDPLGLKQESRDALVKAIPIIGPMLDPINTKLNAKDYEGAVKEISKNIGPALVTEGIGETVRLGKGAVNAATEFNAARNVRAGKTAIHAETNPASYAPASDAVGKAFLKSGAPQEAFDAVNKVFDAGAQPLKQSAERFLGKGAKIENVRDLTHVGDKILPEIYENEILKPARLLDPTDLSKYADELVADIPKNWSPAEQARAESVIRGTFTGTLTGPELAAKLKQLNAANRVNLALNNYEQAAVDALPDGHILNMSTDKVRDILHGKVNDLATKGIGIPSDIKAALQKYGNVTDLVQRAKGDIPLTPEIMDLLTRHSYITGTAPNLYGRAVQTLTAHWTSGDAYIRKAFNKYQGPVTKPQLGPVNNNRAATLAGEQSDLIPFADETDVTGIPHSRTQGQFDAVFGTPTFDAQGNIFNDPMLRGPIIHDTGNMFQGRIPAAWETPNTPPNAMEGMIKYQPPVTAMTPFTGMRNVTPVKPDTGPLIEVRAAGRTPVNQMPQFSSSTRINERQIATTAPKQIGPGFQFTIKGDAPDLIMEGTIAHEPGKITPPIGTVQGASDPRLPAHYMEKNWQRSGEVTTPRTIDGKQTIKEASGPGTLVTTDPKVVESTVKALDDEIKRTRQATKKAELSQLRDDLVRQLVEYNRQRGVK